MTYTSKAVEREKGTYAGNDGTHCGLCLCLCEVRFIGLLVFRLLDGCVIVIVIDDDACEIVMVYDE